MLVSLMDEPEKLLHFSGDGYDFDIEIERIKNGFYLTNTMNFSSYLDTKNFSNINVGDQKVVDIKVLWDNYKAFSKLIVRQSDCGLPDDYECKCDFCNLGTYGVSDNMEQVIKRYENYLINSNDYWLVTGSYVYKEDQPQLGGWRWEKWGSYIGDRTPEADYLYDEPEIAKVMLYELHMLDIF